MADGKFFTSRRLIGRRFDDPTVKKDIESWPFKVVDDEGNPKIEVEYLGEKKTFSAQEISSMVLLKVRYPQLFFFLPCPVVPVRQQRQIFLHKHNSNSKFPTDEGDCRDQAWQEG